MQKSRLRKGLKKIIIKHYCKKCNKLYCTRIAKAWKYEPNMIEFKENYCRKCEEKLKIKLSNNLWNNTL